MKLAMYFFVSALPRMATFPELFRDMYLFGDINTSIYINPVAESKSQNELNKTINTLETERIVAADKGHGTVWHYHILFNQQTFSEEDLNLAIFRTITALRYPFYSLDLEKITQYQDYVITYCSKEVRIKQFDTSESDKIIPSHVLFDIPVKA